MLNHPTLSSLIYNGNTTTCFIYLPHRTVVRIKSWMSVIILCKHSTGLYIPSESYSITTLEETANCPPKSTLCFFQSKRGSPPPWSVAENAFARTFQCWWNTPNATEWLLTSQCQKRERTLHYPIPLQLGKAMGLSPQQWIRAEIVFANFTSLAQEKNLLLCTSNKIHLGSHALKMVESPSALMPEVPKRLYKGKPHTDVDTCSWLLCTVFGDFSQCISGL